MLAAPARNARSVQTRPVHVDRRRAGWATNALILDQRRRTHRLGRVTAPRGLPWVMLTWRATDHAGLRRKVLHRKLGECMQKSCEAHLLRAHVGSAELRSLRSWDPRIPDSTDDRLRGKYGCRAGEVRGRGRHEAAPPEAPHICCPQTVTSFFLFFGKIVVGLFSRRRPHNNIHPTPDKHRSMPFDSSRPSFRPPGAVVHLGGYSPAPPVLVARIDLPSPRQLIQALVMVLPPTPPEGSDTYQHDHGTHRDVRVCTAVHHRFTPSILQQRTIFGSLKASATLLSQTQSDVSHVLLKRPLLVESFESRVELSRVD